MPQLDTASCNCVSAAAALRGQAVACAPPEGWKTYSSRSLGRVTISLLASLTVVRACLCGNTCGAKNVCADITVAKIKEPQFVVFADKRVTH